MGSLKSLKIVLFVLGFVLVAVVSKSFLKSGFKNDAINVVEAVVSKEFMITPGELNNRKEQYLIVDLDESDSSRFDNSIKVQFEKLLEDSNHQRLMDSEKKIVLVSTDISTVSKAWVILHQLDIENVYLLSGGENPEVLKYEFQPDTSARLESVTE